MQRSAARRRALAVGRRLRERGPCPGRLHAPPCRRLRADADPPAAPASRGGRRHRTDGHRAEGRVRRRDHGALRHRDQPARRQPRHHLLDQRLLTRAGRGKARRPRQGHLYRRCAHLVRADRHDRCRLPRRRHHPPAPPNRRRRRFRRPPSSPTARSPHSTPRH